jgi:hypothetical protein
MVNANKRWHRLSTGCVVSAALALTSSLGSAQTPPPEAPPAAAVPAPDQTPAPAVVTPAQNSFPQEVPATAPAAPPPGFTPPGPDVPLAEVPPPPPPPSAEVKDARKSPMTMNAWLRLGTHLQGFKDPEKLNRLSQDGELDLLINAEVLPMVGLTGNLVGSFGPLAGGGAILGPISGSITGDINIMDLIARFDFDDAFHLWVGRMLVGSDRTNQSGPWFIAPWFYPGFFVANAPPLGPHQGPNGRNDGFQVWGQAAGGLFKYYAGMYQLFDTASAPLFSGRLTLSLINPEPGFYGNSQYYGKKDVLGIGIGAQYQKGVADADAYTEFNADILFEKNLSGAGVLDIEGAFYKYTNEPAQVKLSYFALASFLIATPVGPGRLQPLVRVQQATPEDGDTDTWTLVDAQVGYVVDEFACRFALGYQYQDVQGQKGNHVFLGIQLQK